MEETGPRHVLVDVISRQFGGGALGDGATLPKYTTMTDGQRRSAACFASVGIPKRSDSAHTFVYQNCDWSKVWGSAAPSTAHFWTTLRQATHGALESLI